MLSDNTVNHQIIYFIIAVYYLFLVSTIFRAFEILIELSIVNILFIASPIISISLSIARLTNLLLSNSS